MIALYSKFLLWICLFLNTSFSFLIILFLFSDDTRLSLDMDLISDNNDGGLSDKHITPEQLYRKLHNANAGSIHY